MNAHAVPGLDKDRLDNAELLLSTARNRSKRTRSAISEAGENCETSLRRQPSFEELNLASFDSCHVDVACADGDFEDEDTRLAFQQLGQHENQHYEKDEHGEIELAHLDFEDIFDARRPAEGADSRAPLETDANLAQQKTNISEGKIRSRLPKRVSPTPRFYRADDLDAHTHNCTGKLGQHSTGDGNVTHIAPYQYQGSQSHRACKQARKIVSRENERLDGCESHLHPNAENRSSSSSSSSSSGSGGSRSNPANRLPLRTQLSARDILGDDMHGDDEKNDFLLQPEVIVPLARCAFGKSRSLTKPLLAEKGRLVVTGTDQLLTREALATKKKDGALLISRLSRDALARTPSGVSWASSQTGSAGATHGTWHQGNATRRSIDLSSSSSSAGSASLASSTSMPSSAASSASSIPIRQTQGHKVIPLGEACVRDLVWLQPGRQALVGTDTSFGLLRIDSDDQDSLEGAIFEPCEQAGRVKSSTLRQMACSSSDNLNSNETRIVSGGFDRRVQVWRPERVLFDRIAPPESECSTHGIVGSVQWHPSSLDLVSWTLDSGTFEMYDLRAGESVRCLNDCNAHAPAGSMPLFTHAFMGDTTVILGFGNGSTKVIDVRKLQILGGWRDEAVSIIGDVVMSPQATKSVVTGIGGASVYATRAARRNSYTACPMGALTFPIPLYSPGGLRLPAYACKTAATFQDESVCVVVDSGGHLARYHLD